MPEFILDHGTQTASHTFKSLDMFTQGYIEAIFFTEASDRADELYEKTFADVSDEMLQAVRQDCKAFQHENESLLDAAYAMQVPLGRNVAGDYDDHRAGVDFWLTRNRHGAGFWDRGLGDIGDQLTKSAHSYGERDVYVGDDEKVYF